MGRQRPALRGLFLEPLEDRYLLSATTPLPSPSSEPPPAESAPPPVSNTGSSVSATPGEAGQGGSPETTPPSSPHEAGSPVSTESHPNPPPSLPTAHIVSPVPASAPAPSPPRPTPSAAFHPYDEDEEEEEWEHEETALEEYLEHAFPRNQVVLHALLANSAHPAGVPAIPGDAAESGSGGEPLAQLPTIPPAFPPTDNGTGTQELITALTPPAISSSAEDSSPPIIQVPEGGYLEVGPGRTEGRATPGKQATPVELSPETGPPVVGLMPLNLEHLRQTADAFFTQLTRLVQAPADALRVRTLAPWLLLAGAIAWEVVLFPGALRKKGSHQAGWGPEALVYPPGVET